MRLFIYKNNRLLDVIKSSYTGQSTLSDVFSPTITSKYLLDKDKGTGTDTRESIFWATAMLAIKAVKFKASINVLKNIAKEDNSGRTILVDQSSSTKESNGYDFYLDRDTGWCALAKNYTIYREIGGAGNIPDKNSYLQSVQTPPWLDYKNHYGFFSTDGSESFAKKLIKGEESIIPFGAGNFYGEKFAMTLNHLQDMSRVSMLVSETVRAVLIVEWPAAVYDVSIFSYIQGEDQKKTALNEYNKFMKEMDVSHQDISAFNYPSTPAIGTDSFLDKLQRVELYIIAAYQQLKTLISCYHFDNTSLNKELYQKICSGILYALSKVCKHLGNLISGAIHSALGPADLGISDLGKELFNSLSDTLDKKHALYENGGHSEGVKVALDNMLDTIVISYVIFDLFLLKWGVAEVVTKRTPDQIKDKLDMVRKLIVAKNKKVPHSVIERLKEELSPQMKGK
ncbi:hypothetical protein [Reichenbachiella versicolor]|uniref:hypothetical protein n=1 Tax=Reichenbachiella versicolor TaxID=1821036 RepID=UPI000D6E5EB3|nr:hypothetical protein [Reichenbachiella versicolor]